MWLRANLNLEPPQNIPNYSIVFEAIVGSGYKGDVALDEIVFTPNKRCSPVSEFGDLVQHYCDFESNICGYNISGGSTLYNRWVRAKPTYYLGIPDTPPIDNTLQTRNGYYMQSHVRKFLLFL